MSLTDIALSLAAEASEDYAREFGDQFDPSAGDWDAVWLECDPRPEASAVRNDESALAAFGAEMHRLTARTS